MDDNQRKRKKSEGESEEVRVDVKREKIEKEPTIKDLYNDLFGEEEQKHLDLSEKLCTCFCSRDELFIPCYFCGLNDSNFTKQKEERDILFCIGTDHYTRFCYCDNCIFRNFYDIIRKELGFYSSEITKTVIKIYYYFYGIANNKNYNSLYFNCFYYVIKNLLDNEELKDSIIKQLEDMKKTYNIFDFKVDKHFEYKKRFLFDQ